MLFVRGLRVLFLCAYDTDVVVYQETRLFSSLPKQQAERTMQIELPSITRACRAEQLS